MIVESRKLSGKNIFARKEQTAKYKEADAKPGEPEMTVTVCDLAAQLWRQHDIRVVGGSEDVGTCPRDDKVYCVDAVVLQEVGLRKEVAGVELQLDDSGAADSDVVDADELFRIGKIQPKSCDVIFQGRGQSECHLF